MKGWQLGVAGGVGAAALVGLRLLAVPHAPALRTAASSPDRYQKSPHTEQLVVHSGESMAFRYRFRDALAQEWRWEWSFAAEPLYAATQQFGVPTWITEPYASTPQELARRQDAMRTGLFLQDGRVLLPDYNGMAAAYAAYTEPLYYLARQSVGATSDVDKLLLAFVQDIPYGVPPTRDGDTYLGGVVPPTALLSQAWGDCDSKVVLYASTLGHGPSPGLILLHTPDHVLVGLPRIPRPYDRFVTYQNRRYVLADVAGPARLPLGSVGSQGRGSFNRITPVHPDTWAGPVFAASSPVRPVATRSFSDFAPLQVFDHESEKNRMTLRLVSQDRVSVMATLRAGGQELPERFVLAQALPPRRHEVLVSAPAPGEYDVLVYARPLESTGSYRHVLTFPFSAAEGGGTVLPNPFNAFHARGARLQEPLEGRLSAGSTQRFAIAVPDASAVVVVVGERWVHLRPDDGEWTGTASLDADPVRIIARFPSDDSYTVLLSFRVL